MHHYWVVAILALTMHLPALAQAPVVAEEAAKTEAFTQGEVRKLDKSAGKITIKHAEIKHLDMPPMTMVFKAKDAALLDRVKPGDRINFKVEAVGGDMLITDIQMVTP